MMKKSFCAIMLLVSAVIFGQVPYPHTANDAGVMMAERIASFSVVGAGNDRFEITNATNFDGQFVPQLWSYRETDNRFTLGIAANISSATDNGTSPLMIFSTSIPTQLQLNAPTTGVFPWGNPGTANPIVNRPLFQWNNANNRLMTIIANGNLGLGTVSPTARFHNLGSVRFENLANSTNPNFVLGTDANGNVFEYNVSSVAGSGDADWLKPDGTVAMSINDDIYTNGKVGINAQNPTANLHSNGSVRFENLANSSNPGFVLGTDANGNVFEYNVSSVTGSGDADWLKPDGTVAMSINDDIYNNGKVGIGVNNFPTSVGAEDVSFYKLFVKGGVLTEEVRVALDSEWADYVFKKEYKLPTLQEVEAHIKKEGHLKDIPSAKEVKDNGVELGEMNKLLLQKIEELTLYVIDLNKKVEEQKEQINELKKAKK
jgi:hypothetical protein